MKAHATTYSQRLLRGQPPSYERLQARLAEDGNDPAPQPVAVHCGWGRLLVGHTFADPAALADELLNERDGERDIALYVAAPQQVLAQAPQQLFLDPSDTLRLWFSDYRPATRVFRGFRIRRAQSREDWLAINQLYVARGMLPIDPERLTPRHQGGPVYWLAEDEDSGALIGSVMGLNHHKAFHDPEHGCSLWCLAVDPQCSRPGVGEVLVRHLIEHFMSRGLNHLDLSVLHDNRQAKSLYAKLGFRTLSTFAIKRKNGINQPLFLGPGPQAEFNPYARILVEEAHRRGIDVQVDDAAAGMFTLTHGGRRVRCRESLTDLTSAISMSLCQDKSLTHRVLRDAGLNVPHQQLAATAEDNRAFLRTHQRIVVKPTRRGGRPAHPRGRRAGHRRGPRLRQAGTAGEFPRRSGSAHRGDRLPGGGCRAAPSGPGDRRRPAQHRRPDRSPEPPTPGRHRRTLHAAGYDYNTILAQGEQLAVRRTANLHTGGSLEDVTGILHPTLAEAAIQAARALDIPVVGLDLMVPAADQPEYVFIEANERCGLANHEPQPTAERFIDLLFPHSRPMQ